MNLKIEEVGDQCVVTPQEDRLDAAASATFRTAVVNLIEQGNHQILMDLEKIQFMDSGGLGAIIALAKTLEAQGQLIICGLTPPVERLFSMTRMDQAVQVYGNREQALSQTPNSKTE